MKKQWVTFLVVVIAVYLFIGRDWGVKYQTGEVLQLDLFWGDITLYHDNHDPLWHNDGITVMVMQFSGQAAERICDQMENSTVWESFPLSQRLRQIACERAWTWDTPATFSEMVGLSQIENGYWFFVDQDKYRNGTLVYGQRALDGLGQQEGMMVREEPGAYAMAFYDLDTHTLYYYQRNV